MGEILQARHDHLADLTQAETLALLAIANRCKPKSRLASVAFQEIRDAIGFAHRSPTTGCSERTGRRVLKSLRDYGLIEIVQRGHKPRGKPTVAPIYQIAEKLVTSLVAQANSGSLRHETGKLVPPEPEACATAYPPTCGDSAINVREVHAREVHEEIPPANAKALAPPKGGTHKGEIVAAEAVRPQRLCATGCGRPSDVWNFIDGLGEVCDECYRTPKRWPR